MGPAIAIMISVIVAKGQVTVVLLAAMVNLCVAMVVMYAVITVLVQPE